MKIPFIEKIGIPAKADPKKIRREQLRRKSINFKYVICVFAVIVVLLAAVSIITVVKEQTKNENIEENLSSSDESSESVLINSSTGENRPYINKNVLLMLTKDNTTNIHLLAILNFDSSSDSISLTYVPISSRCFINNVDGNMNEHLLNGGIKELLWAVKEYTQMNIDRYIYCDENKFTEFIKSIGEFNLNIENEINSTYNGVNFTIEKGEQSFTADSMLKYFLYLCEHYSSENEKLTELISCITEKILVENNDTSVAEKFNRFVKYVNTDISAIDIAKYSAALEQLIISGNHTRMIGSIAD